MTTARLFDGRSMGIIRPFARIVSPFFAAQTKAGMGKGGGRERNRSLPVRNNLLVRCGSCYFSSLHPIPSPFCFLRSSTLLTMFLMNNHADILMLDVYSRVISSESHKPGDQLRGLDSRDSPESHSLSRRRLIMSLFKCQSLVTLPRRITLRYLLRCECLFETITGISENGTIEIGFVKNKNER